MMVGMGSHEKRNMDSLINDKWRHEEANRLVGFSSGETWPTHILK